MSDDTLDDLCKTLPEEKDGANQVVHYNLPHCDMCLIICR